MKGITGQIESIVSYEADKIKSFAREVSVSGRLQTRAKRFLEDKDKSLRKLTPTPIYIRIMSSM